MISSSNHKRQTPYELYMLKKNKQPDYLFSMLEKSKKQKQNVENADSNSLDFKVKQAIRRHMIQKRVNNILNQASPKPIPKDKIKISQPVKCTQKAWIPPIQKQINDKKFSQQQLILEAKKKQQKRLNKQKISSIVKTINLNKKMKYFGDFLSSQFDNYQDKRNSLSICNIPKTKQSKLSFLQAKFKKLISKDKPKLFILNSPTQQQKYFYNPLVEDQYYSTIMRTNDRDLMRILIKTLSQEDHFSLTSLTKFYDIFVWQCAQKQQLTKFAAKILMVDRQQMPITKISLKIDEICGKINLEELNQSVQNFSEIMKKLLFGQQFVFALKNEYFLTRKALIDSLQRNEECISIFINVFYI